MIVRIEKKKVCLKPCTFLPLPFPPFFFCPAALNPLTSSSSTIEGGLTFLPHVGAGSCTGSEGLGGSTKTGGAKMTAEDETVAEARAAPTGSLGAAGFDFC